MTITRIQANAAAELVRAIRPGWDSMATATVIAELAEALPFAAVMDKAILAAGNPEYRSPTAIKWQELPHVTPSGKYAHESRCAICQMRFTRCRDMANRTGDHHAFSKTD